jgi:hypothetical protein
MWMHVVAVLACCALLSVGVPAQSSAQLLPLAGQLRADALKPEEGFSGVVGATFLPDGTILVGDAGRRSLHRFTSLGQYSGSIGRGGKGPGEFEELGWMVTCADGSTLVFDSRLYRISVYDRTVAFTRSFVPPAWYAFDSVLSCDNADQLVLLLDQPRYKPTERGRSTTFPAVVARANWTSARLDTVRALPGTEFYFATTMGYVELPLGKRALAASAGGGIVSGASNDTAVVFINGDSRVADTLFVRGARVGATLADWDRATRDRIDMEHAADTRALISRVLKEAAPPKFLPLFDALLVDKYSRAVWARRFGRGKLAEWVRLNPVKGKPAGFVLPINVQVMDVSRTTLLGLRRNADGTEDVLLYKFQR